MGRGLVRAHARAAGFGKHENRATRVVLHKVLPDAGRRAHRFPDAVESFAQLARDAPNSECSAGKGQQRAGWQKQTGNNSAGGRRSYTMLDRLDHACAVG